LSSKTLRGGGERLKGLGGWILDIFLICVAFSGMGLRRIVVGDSLLILVYGCVRKMVLLCAIGGHDDYGTVLKKMT